MVWCLLTHGHTGKAQGHKTEDMCLGRRGNAAVERFLPCLLRFATELLPYSQAAVLRHQLGRSLASCRVLATCCKMLTVIAGTKLIPGCTLKTPRCFTVCPVNKLNVSTMFPNVFSQSPYWIFLSFSIFIMAVLSTVTSLLNYFIL